MGMESFGKKAKNAIRAALVFGAATGAVTAEGTVKEADAQTIQQSQGNNSPNIVGSGNVVNMNRSGGAEIVTPGGNIVRMPGIGKPNIVTNPDGSIRQESRGENSPNIIDKKFRQ